MDLIFQSFDFYPKGRIGFYRSLFACNVLIQKGSFSQPAEAVSASFWLHFAATSKKTKKITL
jgi:hypothetical protein